MSLNLGGLWERGSFHLISCSSDPFDTLDGDGHLMILRGPQQFLERGSSHFFHEFERIGSTILNTRYIHMPVTAEVIALYSKEFEEAGIPCCVETTDATHITMKN